MKRKDPGGRSNSSLPSRSASLQERRYAVVYTKSSYYIENPSKIIRRRDGRSKLQMPFRRSASPVLGSYIEALAVSANLTSSDQVTRLTPHHCFPNFTVFPVAAASRAASIISATITFVSNEDNPSGFTPFKRTARK